MLLPFVKRINTTIKLSFWIKVPIIYLIFAIKEVFFLRMSFKFVNQAHNLGDQLIFKKFHRYLKLQIQYFEFLRTLGRNICLFSPVPTLQLSVWIPEDLLLLHRTPLGRSNSRSLRKTATAGATKRQSNKSIKMFCFKLVSRPSQSYITALHQYLPRLSSQPLSIYFHFNTT